MHTKPTIETLLLKMEEMKTHFDQRFDELKSEISRVNRKIAILSDDTVGLRADVAELREQQEKLVIAVNSVLPTKML